MEATTTKRVPNFSAIEKEALLSLIAQKFSVLEDKKTNRTSLSEKNRAWAKIQDEFNATAPVLCYRSVDSLKRLYENQKKELRKRMAEEKKQRFLTGGGAMPALKNYSKDHILFSILNEKTVVGMENQFDADYDQTTIQSTINDQTLYLNRSRSEVESDFTEAHYYSLDNDLLFAEMDGTTSTNDKENILAPKPEPSGQISSCIIKKNSVKEKNCLLTEPGFSGQHSCNKSKNPEEKNCFLTKPGTSSDNRQQNEVERDNPWKKFKTGSLQLPRNQALQNNYNHSVINEGNEEENTLASSHKIKNTPNSSRRRPSNHLKILTSSDVAHKYNVLLDQRLILVKKLNTQQDEEYEFKKEEQKLKLQLLKLDIIYKQAQIQQQFNINVSSD